MNLDYYTQEFVLDAQSTKKHQKVQWLEKIKQSIATMLYETHEPTIHEVHDVFGRSYWKIYDPLSRKILYLDSENEVRIWLDRRYYL